MYKSILNCLSQQGHLPCSLHCSAVSTLATCRCAIVPAALTAGVLFQLRMLCQRIVPTDQQRIYPGCKAYAAAAASRFPTCALRAVRSTLSTGSRDDKNRKRAASEIYTDAASVENLATVLTAPRAVVAIWIPI